MIEIDEERQSGVPYPLRCFYARFLEIAFEDLKKDGNFGTKGSESPTSRIVRITHARRNLEDWFFRDGYQPESITVAQVCDILNLSLSAVRKMAREIIQKNRGTP
jgi:cyclopropane fatty-acyl-phospholipid synthase-like methyltransferase